MKTVRNGMAYDEIPEDSESELWIEDLGGNISLSDLLNKAKDKWPDASLEDIAVSAVKHHQYNIYYDLYDPSDYVEYVVLNLQ